MRVCLQFRLHFCFAIVALCWFCGAQAASIYPIDRATILSGSKFDFKVEFDGVMDEAQSRITINGSDYKKLLQGKPQWIHREDGAAASSLILRDNILTKPGVYKVVATDGSNTKEANWEVYATGSRKAKNVILFIGDGMSVANRTAARMLSKGISEGKYYGQLSFDDMPYMALVGTSGAESIVTDSANSMSAYTTGHKSSNGAMGVYMSRANDTQAHPRVENITELIKRKTGMAVGIVTDAEVEDATPAAMVAHTSHRDEKASIANQLFRSGADVILGGGSAYFLPQGVSGSRRKDDVDLLASFRQAGYPLTTTAAELQAVATATKTNRLLGLYHLGNMDGALDRHVLKPTGPFPDQPDLTDMTRAALQVLSRNKKGFVLMIESAEIDKANHAIDWEASVYNTIMLSNAVQIAKDFAAKNKDTLIIVTPDHTHAISIIGTVDDDKPGTEMREKLGVYDAAGFPNYPAAGPDGYPATVDVSRRLALSYGNTQDYYETFKPRHGEAVMLARSRTGASVPGPAGALLRTGVLTSGQAAHSADDGVLTALGPGAEKFHGFIDNTMVFRNIVDALGLAPAGRKNEMR